MTDREETGGRAVDRSWGTLGDSYSCPVLPPSPGRRPAAAALITSSPEPFTTFQASSFNSGVAFRR
ncbi:hypothetical protein E2C01_091540 [Portunus trituberculatus]|uniref:Uncharacterized protein n=1 Tax=Portunus trituberculatus TaxID=210409 RepID=A0A5B7JN76_PORTR|nr:hypothetical protein [Portunus trituberculatus]